MPDRHFNVEPWVRWVESSVRSRTQFTNYPWFLSKTKTKLVILHRHRSRSLRSILQRRCLFEHGTLQNNHWAHDTNCLMKNIDLQLFHISRSS